MGKAGKKNGLKRFFITLLIIIVVLPLAWIVFSLAGRMESAALIPGPYIVRARIHNPARAAGRLLKHEALPQLLGGSALQAAMPAVNSLRDSGLLDKPLARFAARGSLDAALLADGAGTLVAAWDSSFCSPLLRFLPFLSRFITVPNLYYVQAGKLSRFEYRTGETAWYIGPRRNLLVICNNRGVFESLISGAPLAAKTPDAVSSSTARRREDGSSLDPAGFDAVLLFSPAYIGGLFAGQDDSSGLQDNPEETAAAAVMRNLEFSGMAEAGITVSPGKLEALLAANAASASAPLRRILEQRSGVSTLAELLPASAQYATVLSAGTLSELFEAASVFSGPGFAQSLSKADSSSRMFLGMSLEELLFSWSGREFAVFGMEGRPHPVYAVQIAGERKREAVFNRAFKTIALNENARLNLDGARIPRIEVPGFLQSLLQRWDVRIPSPYYTVHAGCLLASESAETLLAAVRAMQKNDVLPKTQAWRNLAGNKADSSSFTLYYSLDRSIPFFLRGKNAASSVLGTYRQGLARLGFDKGAVKITLAVIPGSGRGLALMSGYPLSPGGNLSNRVYRITAGRENRILLSRDNKAIAINPADNTIRELEGPAQGAVWTLPACGITPKTLEDPAAWVVSAQGRVTLVNANMEAVQGFPVSTGMRLASPPAAFGGRLYLHEKGETRSVDAKGTAASWNTVFDAELRSPPSFLALPGGRVFAAAYPKSFLGEIWLLDETGKALPNWPAPVSGIAFGSPLLFAHNNSAHAAFVTQAGELSVFGEDAAPLPPFPLDLEDVFYTQPAFDGELLWLVSAGGTLFQVSLAGVVLKQNIPGFAAKEEGYITTFDVDGDKVPEIFVSGEGNAFHGYARNFRSLEGFPLPVWGRPLFADLNGDGKIECIGAGMDKKLYRWQFK
jgi:hypothetical protein